MQALQDTKFSHGAALIFPRDFIVCIFIFNYPQEIFHFFLDFFLDAFSNEPFNVYEFVYLTEICLLLFLNFIKLWLDRK